MNKLETRIPSVGAVCASPPANRSNVKKVTFSSSAVNTRKQGLPRLLYAPLETHTNLLPQKKQFQNAQNLFIERKCGRVQQIPFIAAMKALTVSPY